MKVTKNEYCVYILTNKSKNVLYIGMTNNLPQRLSEHYQDRIEKKHFAGKYNCYFLVYYEVHHYVYNAIERENELKRWVRRRKDELIAIFNPEWKFLNEIISGEWPPKDQFKRSKR